MKHIAIVHSNKDFTQSMIQATAVMIFRHLKLHIVNQLDELSHFDYQCQVIFLEENCQCSKHLQNQASELIVIKGQCQNNEACISVFSPISKWLSLLNSFDTPSYLKQSNQKTTLLGDKKYPVVVLLEMRESIFQNEALVDWARKLNQKQSNIELIDMTPLCKLSKSLESNCIQSFYTHPVDAIESLLDPQIWMKQLEEHALAIYCEFNRADVLVPVIQMANDLILLWGDDVPDSLQLEKMIQWIKWHNPKASLSLLRPYHRKQNHTVNIHFIDSIETRVGETYEMPI